MGPLVNQNKMKTLLESILLRSSLSIMSDLPGVATTAVFVESETLPAGTPKVSGYDFDQGPFDWNRFMDSYLTTGFQGTNLGLAIQEVNKMLQWTLNDEPITEDDDITDPEERKKVKCRIFLGYTSNLISSGVREILRYLVRHNMVSCIVSTAGGIEEDLIKCLAPTYLGDFNLNGEDLRRRGLNRIGNLLVPNQNYCLFEDWIYPVLNQMLKEQVEENTIWTPSKMIHRFGREIDNPESVYYWAYKNDIPVFCPALTDGSIGDMIYFHSYKSETKLIVDIAGDIKRINDIAVYAKKTGVIILGGGVVKHHICNANLMRNGADYSVFINTGQEFDGSDSGARPDEAISWGKIRANAGAVKVYADATLVFPLLVAATFAKHVDAQKEEESKK